MLRFAAIFSIALFLCLAGCHSTYRLERETISPVRAIERSQVELRDGRRIKLPYADDPDATLLILVRHAEKNSGDDPNLAPAGVRRALLLSDILLSLPLAVVYTTDFKRTKQTAQLTALRQNIVMKEYEPSNLVTLAYKLSTRYKGKAVLVVGHSDTTPELINILAGKKVVERIPEYEYDKLFVVAINAEKHKDILMLTYELEPENVD